MAGGTWDFQNKIQPGIYINFKGSPTTLVTVGTRGVVAIPKSMEWGDPDEIIEINATNEVLTKLGYDITSPEMLWVREIFRGSNRTSGAASILVGRLGTTAGVKATASLTPLTVTAKYVGTRGNDITMVVAPDLDTEYTISDGEEPPNTTTHYAVYRVETIVDNVIRDSQTIGSFTSETEYVQADVSELIDNDWVTFSGTGEPVANAGTALAGGDSGTLTASAYADFLDKIEPFTFNVLIYDGIDPTTKTAFATFITRMGYNEGKYAILVVSNYHTADEILVVSVDNGFVLNDDTVIAPEQATWWVGGVQAAATVAQSLTYASHPDAIRAEPRMTSAELDTAIKQGSLVFIEEFGLTKILTDINTFTSYTPEKGTVFSKNRTIRVLTSIANDIYAVFAQYYLGVVDNTPEGRNLFKAEIISYMIQLQGVGAIQNFDADDVIVTPGLDVDAIRVDVAVQVVNAVEKVYMTVTVTAEEVAA